MFHVEFLIDDKDYTRLRHTLLSFKIFNYEDKPVVNAKKTRGGKIEEEVPGGKLQDRLAATVREQFVGQEISTKQINDLVTELGGSPCSNYIASLVKSKTIKRKGRGTFVLSK